MQEQVTNNFLFETVLSDSSITLILPCVFTIKHTPAYFSKENLAYYLAGLIEGDGSFNVPKFLKDSGQFHRQEREVKKE